MGNEPVYGDRRKCPFCHLPIPDHHSWCKVGQALNSEVAALRRRIMRRRKRPSGET